MIQGTELVALENAIESLPPVLGCVILTDAEGSPSEIQAFIQAGADAAAVRISILQEVEHKALGAQLGQVLVFELEAGSELGNRETLERAAEVAEREAPPEEGPPPSPKNLGETPAFRPPGRSRARPPLQKVLLSSSTRTAAATVSLGEGEGAVVGEATGEKTPHGLKVLAEATLAAVSKMVDAPFTLAGASLIDLMGREAVLVLVHEGDEGSETVGAALVRGGPVTEAAVRATLDAVNRRVEMLTRHP
ncbi:MAG: hypothetical protein M3345_00345 [Actinomycetota bacterium]|nr:hypothetical protein [Actinomycetota bacterium]